MFCRSSSIAIIYLSSVLVREAACLHAQENLPSSSRIGLIFAGDQKDPSLNTQRFLLSPEVVVDPADQSMRLAHSVLIASERGATDFHQTESLSEKAWAKKVFRLPNAELKDPELFFFGSAKSIQVNGKEIPQATPLKSTGWMRAKFDSTVLPSITLEVVFRDGGSLLIEPDQKRTGSFKSTDSGRNWSDRNLGCKGNQQGEYLIRLRSKQFESLKQGTIRSAVFDLWDVGAGTVVFPGRTVCFAGLKFLQNRQPEGTALVPQLRTGSTPAPDSEHWTDWTDLDQQYRPSAQTAGHRWAQIKFNLSTLNPHVTPRLPAQFKFEYDFQPDFAATRDHDSIALVLEGTADRYPEIGSVPFVYQEPSPRLKLLRERYQLDKVIAPGQTEMEQLMLLRHWVRNQWHSAWGSHPAAWMPPWDSLMILECKDQPDCLTMCTHYAAVFTQCCLALGWNARHCVLDHHCVSEVFVNQHNKWVMMDAGNSKERADVSLHFEKDRIPLSARELHLAYRTGKTAGTMVCFTPVKLMKQVAALCRPAPGSHTSRPDVISLKELKAYPVCQLENYRRYAFPGRNNYLATLFPGELYQGWSRYFYDGSWWVGDSPDDPQLSPEYSFHLSPSRSQDIDWSVNWTRVHLARTKRPEELRVDLETFTPNLARLEKWTGDSWQASPASFLWKLEMGENALRVRSVNQFERPGVEAKVRVQKK